MSQIIKCTQPIGHYVTFNNKLFLLIDHDYPVNNQNINLDENVQMCRNHMQRKFHTKMDVH